MTALLCAVLGTAWGQDVTLDFTTNDVWQFPEGSSNKATEAKAFSNGTYTITLEGSEGNGYYFNTDGYLILGKNGSSLTLPAFDFAVGTIEVVGNSSASTAVVQNIFVGENPVSTQTEGARGTKYYKIAAGSQTAGTIYTLKVLSNHNTQITKINIYKVGNAPKLTPTMSFSGTAFTVTEGDDFEEPTLTYDGDGVVTYSSDNEEVATVDESTGEVDVVAPGNVNITATATETNNYKGATASYKITVKAIQGIVDGTFDFTGTQAYGSGLTPSAPEGSDPETFIWDDKTWTAGNVKLVSSGKYRWWYAAAGNDLRFYNNKVDDVQTSKMTISVPEGKKITSIQITGGQKFVSDDGLYASGKWEGEAQSVTLRYAATSGNVAVKTVTVTYTDGTTPAEKQKPTMKFNPNYVNFFLGGTFTAPELTYDGDGAVTYASDNEEVATVNATTGAVTIKGIVGKAVIKASASETDNYEAAEAIYTINVAEPQNTHEVVDGTFDFTDATDYGSGLTPSDANVYITEPSTWKAGNVTLVAEGKYRWWLNASGNTLRLYTSIEQNDPEGTPQGTKITISVPAGKKINKIDFTGSGINFTASTGEFANSAWTGDAQTVVLTYNGSGTIQIKTITVDYGGNRIDPAFAWSAESATATIGQPFTAPTLSYAQGFNGEITYTSSNENVATISATGAVTIVGAGTTTIKATTPSTPDYLESSAAYTLTVTDPAASNVTYDFTGTNNYGTELEPSNDGSLYIYDDYTWKNEPVSLVTSGKYRWWLGTNGNTLRLYSQMVEEEETTKLTFSVPAGKSITAIEFEVGVNDAFTANVGEFGGKSWAGDAQSVVLTLAKDKKPYISTIKVTYKDASGILLGDANGDGEVNITDVTVVVNYVLTKEASLINLTNADANQDGDVNITDVTNIVNIILSTGN